MCEHREHRTGNCRECTPALASGGLVQSGGRVDTFVDPYATCPPIMPKIWDGDDS